MILTTNAYYFSAQHLWSGLVIEAHYVLSEARSESLSKMWINFILQMVEELFLS